MKTVKKQAAHSSSRRTETFISVGNKDDTGVSFSVLTVFVPPGLTIQGRNLPVTTHE
jgi:hypothetical protein